MPSIPEDPQVESLCVLFTKLSTASPETSIFLVSTKNRHLLNSRTSYACSKTPLPTLDAEQKDRGLWGRICYYTSFTPEPTFPIHKHLILNSTPLITDPTDLILNRTSVIRDPTLMISDFTYLIPGHTLTGLCCNSWRPIMVLDFGGLVL